MLHLIQKAIKEVELKQKRAGLSEVLVEEEKGELI